MVHKSHSSGKSEAPRNALSQQGFRHCSPDRKPPRGLTGIGGGSGIYDVRGPYFYSGFVAKF